MHPKNELKLISTQTQTHIRSRKTQNLQSGLPSSINNLEKVLKFISKVSHKFASGRNSPSQRNNPTKNPNAAIPWLRGRRIHQVGCRAPHRAGARVRALGRAHAGPPNGSRGFPILVYFCIYSFQYFFRFRFLICGSGLRIFVSQKKFWNFCTFEHTVFCTVGDFHCPGSFARNSTLRRPIIHPGCHFFGLLVVIFTLVPVLKLLMRL